MGPRTMGRLTSGTGAGAGGLVEGIELAGRGRVAEVAAAVA